MARQTLFRTLSIRTKLMLIGLSTLAIALVSISVVQTILHWQEGKQHAAEDLMSTAQLFGLHAAHELSSGHRQAVAETLAALKARPEIGYAAFYDAAGRMIASYRSAGGVPIVPEQLPAPDTWRVTAIGLVVAARMSLNGQEQGVLYLQSDLRELYEHIAEHAMSLALSGLVAFVLAGVLFSGLQRVIVDPLRELAEAMEAVSARHDYALRVRKSSHDEIGLLADGFNTMLAAIAARDGELAQHRQRLEEEVGRRTAELSAARDFLEGVTRISAAAVFALDPEGRFEFVNDRAVELSGYGRDELLRQPFIRLFPADARDSIMADFSAILQGETVYAHESVVVRKDGAARWIGFSAGPVVEDGKIVRIVGTAADITERKQAALAIESSELKLRAILEATTNGLVAVDAQTRKTMLVNRAFCDMLGYSREEVAALGVEDFHPAESLPHVLRQFERQVRGELKVAADMPVKRKDGSVFFADISTSAAELDGRTIMVGAFHDTTERKRMVEALRKSEEQFRNLVESTSDLVWEVDSKGVYTYVSPRIRDLLGYAPEEILGKAPFDLMPPQEAQRVAGEFARLLAAHQPIRTIENINRHKDGHLVVLETSGMPFFLPDGRLGGYRGTDRDVTERIQAQRELEFKTTLLATQQETSPDGILVVDAQAKILYYNRRFVEIWDIPRELIEAGDDEPVLQLVVSRQSDPAAFLARVKYLYEHRQESSHEELALSDGTTVDRYSAPMFGSDGTYYGRVWYFRDITERKRNEAIIKASLAEKEALLREIHHRVKNNMQVVISLLNLEAGRIEDPAVVRMLRDAQRRIEVMALVHEKLHQSRELAEVDAKAYIEDLARSAFHAQERRGGEVRLALAVEPVGLNLDAATPCGLIVNELISNALKHAFPGDRAGEIRVALQTADDAAVELAVSDDGVGMPADFDWRGSKTLGLRLVRNLVERQLQGRLDLDRTQGTAWRIRFAA